MRCGGMSCEEMTMTEDLMQLLAVEVTDSEFESPDAVSTNIYVFLHFRFKKSFANMKVFYQKAAALKWMRFNWFMLRNSGCLFAVLNPDFQMNIYLSCVFLL